MSKRIYRWVICLIGLLSAIAFNFAQVPPIQAIPKPTELRGVWLTNVASGVLYTPWGVNRAISQLAKLKFNTIYPVVWNRGNTFYPSSVTKKVTGRDRDLSLQVLKFNQDVLAQIVKQAHRQGLRVIPWFEYGFMAPTNSQIAKRHPDWLTARRNASKISVDVNQQKATNSKVVDPMLTKGVWLNPFHPEVQKFMLNMIVEVVTNYDVEGIQFDDHFGLPSDFGYDRFTVNLYQQEHQGKNPPNNPQDAQWLRWRADKLTNFMERVYKAVKAVKPKCLVTLSPNPQEYAYRATLQDWQTWVNRGLVEELICQIYRNDQKTFLAELQQTALQTARKKIPVGIGILTGSVTNPVALKQIKQQVQLVRDRGYSGVSFFYWESLWGYITPESPQERRNGFSSLFSIPKPKK
ncbi:glycoside hydrolase family 10 protein [Synechocystis sp. PCC 7509]|uniref:glycoside hydrolase family 10 protein n=1 Tax=Synechocystis sp. PCC 7509 TaxID=927677 RepID=UPI0009071087|nr:glycoside hydrolase family 10 protein [Synechocystis sp. PCC 7509]